MSVSISKTRKWWYMSLCCFLFEICILRKSFQARSTCHAHHKYLVCLVPNTSVQALNDMNQFVGTKPHLSFSASNIRGSVDSLCRDDADMPKQELCTTYERQHLALPKTPSFLRRGRYGSMRLSQRRARTPLRR